MANLISEVPQPIQTLLILVLFFILKALWDKRDRKEEKHDTALNQNTIALVELKTEFKLLRETFSDTKADVKKLKDDVGDLHRFKREVEKQI